MSHLAPPFVDSLAVGGATSPTDIVLNQVLVGFGENPAPTASLNAVQGEGHLLDQRQHVAGRRLMGLSVSNRSTTEADVDRSVEAVLRLARV